MNFGEICYALQQGFVGHIKNNFRGITIKVIDKTMHVRVYLENEPKEIDYDLVKTAVSEAESLMTSVDDYVVELIQSNEAKIHMLDFWFYRRYEGEYD